MTLLPFTPFGPNTFSKFPIPSQIPHLVYADLVLGEGVVKLGEEFPSAFSTECHEHKSGADEHQNLEERHEGVGEVAGAFQTFLDPPS